MLPNVNAFDCQLAYLPDHIRVHLVNALKRERTHLISLDFALPLILYELSGPSNRRLPDVMSLHLLVHTVQLLVHLIHVDILLDHFNHLSCIFM